jgi:hypothetical protein
MKKTAKTSAKSSNATAKVMTLMPIASSSPRPQATGLRKTVKQRCGMKGRTKSDPTVNRAQVMKKG